MSNGRIEKAKKIGNWLSALLLGDTREIIARIDERTTHIAKDLDDIRPKVWDISPKVDSLVKDMNDIRPKVWDMAPKVDHLWKDRIAPAHSPRQLNDRGMLILEQSGIKEIVERRETELVKLVQESHPTNAYDAEQAIVTIMNNLQMHFPDITELLKDGAFKVGSDIPTVLFVGSIYLRNRIFETLGFSLGDIDAPSSASSSEPQS